MSFLAFSPHVLLARSLAAGLTAMLSAALSAQQIDSDLITAACDSPIVEACEIPIERYRKSFYQGTEVLGGYLADFSGPSDGLDQSFAEARVSFGLPLGSMDNLLGIRPYFRTDLFHGDVGMDLPNAVYDTGVALLHQWKWTAAMSSTSILIPAVRSDFTTSEKAFRLFGLALVNWQPREDWKLSLGVVYFDRADLRLLPAFGATWTPTPTWKFDMTMPRPRIAHRLWKRGGEAEGWAFFGGTLGGNTWAVSRAGGSVDELTVSDLRVLAGYELIGRGNRGLSLEGGYAFDRSIEYERESSDTDLDDAVFIRANWQF